MSYLSFCVGSDGHITHNKQITISLLDMMSQEDVDFSVLCGDMDEHGHLEVVETFIRKLKKVHGCAGNHDKKKNWQKVFGYHLYKKITVKGWDFLFLYTPHSGSILLDVQQWDWLNNALSESNAPKMIFTHMPPKFVKRWEHHSYDAFYTHNLFLNANVKAVFCGHIHTYDYERVDDIDYYVTGGLGGIPRNLGKHLSESPFHYLRVDIEQDESYTVTCVHHTEG